MRSCFAAIAVLSLVASSLATNMREKAKLQDSAIRKVLGLLEDMAAKVEGDMRQTTKDFELFAHMCDDEATAKEHAITTSNGKIDELKASLEDAQAAAEELDTDIQDTSGKIAEAEGEMKAAASVREKEQADFKATESELLDTVDTLYKAIAPLKKMSAASFAQLSKADRAQVKMVVKGFSAIVESAWVSQAQRTQLQSFLQQRDEDDDELEEKEEPEKFDNTALVEMLEEMSDKAEEQLSEARKAEMETAHEFAMLSQGSNNEIASLKKEMATSSRNKQVQLEIIGQSEKNLGMEKTSLAESQKALKELKHDCQAKAGDYELEAKDGAAELGALKKAQAILEDNQKGAAGASFLQVNSRTRLRTRAQTRFLAYDAGDTDRKKMAALNSIQALGKRLHSTALVSLAFRAAEDPFGKVRSMVEEMLAKLAQEAANEATQQAFCEKEVGESKVSQADKDEKISVIDARVGRMEASQAQLMDELSVLRAEVSSIDSSMTEATKIRMEERETYLRARKDFAESQEACAAAVQALRDYYEGGSSFLQVSARTRARSVAAADAGSGENDAGGVIGLLEVSEAEFTDLVAEADAAEHHGQEEYDKLNQDNKILKTNKLTAIKFKDAELMNLKSSLDELSQDKGGLSQELDAVVEYLDKLKPQCETKAPSYAVRKERRDQEIEGLKEALQLLDA